MFINYSFFVFLQSRKREGLGLIKIQSRIVQEKDIRLDLYLKNWLSDYSRSKIQLLVKDGSIKINGESEKPSYRLKGDETISLHIKDPDDNQDHLNAEPMPLNIIYEDEAIIGINKPAGLVVHPGVGNRTGMNH